MILSERTLRKWRKEALIAKEKLDPPLDKEEKSKLERNERVIKMTQELLDLHLLRRKT